MGSDIPPRPARRPQPWPIRLAHWVNLPALVILAGSGLQILVAYPAFGPRGAAYGWYPLQRLGKPPDWLTLGGWLAGGRALHFAFAWLFVGNGLLYLAYLLGSGEWRRRLFCAAPRRGRSAGRARYYLRLRKERPGQALYNGAAAPRVHVGPGAGGARGDSPGWRSDKPVQLPWLAGRVRRLRRRARRALRRRWPRWRSSPLGHVCMVALHPRTLREMITGGSGHEPPGVDDHRRRAARRSAAGPRWRLRFGAAARRVPRRDGAAGTSACSAGCCSRPTRALPACRRRRSPPRRLSRVPHLALGPAARHRGWALEVGGLVARPLVLSLDDLRRLPRTDVRIGHSLRRGLDRGGRLARRADCADAGAARGRRSARRLRRVPLVRRRLLVVAGIARARCTRRRSSPTG